MKKRFNVAIVLLLLLVMLAGCTLLQPNTLKEVNFESQPSNVVAIHTDRQYTFLQKDFSGASGKKENSKPESIKFSWDFGGNSKNYTIAFSENEDMSNAITYQSTNKNIKVCNFKVATQYYWRITANGQTSETKSFTTEDSLPRNLSVDGVTNVRDLGGWEIANGGRIKQGLIYRCGRLNESNTKTTKIEITNDGINTMLNILGIKSEIDLREVSNNETGGITSSPLGNSVTYHSLPMEWDGNLWQDNQNMIIKMFEILANPANYPLIFHCNIGTDRTGMMAFLVGALLGMSEDDLITDYMFSNLGKIGGARYKTGVTNNTYYKAVMEANGSTLSEKTYNALVSHGVPAENLNSVIKILKG